MNREALAWILGVTAVAAVVGYATSSELGAVVLFVLIVYVIMPMTASGIGVRD